MYTDRVLLENIVEQRGLMRLTSKFCHGRAGSTKKWHSLVSTALAAAVVTFSPGMPAMADLNKFEADMRGEFGIGSAAQFGSADLRYSI